MLGDHGKWSEILIVIRVCYKKLKSFEKTYVLYYETIILILIGQVVIMFHIMALGRLTTRIILIVRVLNCM